MLGSVFNALFNAPQRFSAPSSVAEKFRKLFALMKYYHGQK